jgi:hypothetical protein
MKEHSLKNIFFGFLALVSLKAQAQSEIKPHMQNFYLSIEKLNQYIIDKNIFIDPQNSNEVDIALKEFNKKITELKKDNYMNSDDLKFRFKLLSEGLSEAESSFKSGSKDYSYWVLKSTLNNCFACHTQKGLGQTNYSISLNSKINDFNKAEFLFLYRNYNEASKIYEQILVNHPKNANFENAETSLNRLMFYQVRVLKNDIENLALLNRLAQNENLPSFLRNNILAWRKYLNVKKFRVFENTKINTPAQLKSFIDSRNTIASHYKLHGQRYLVDLETSSFLYSLLDKSENKNIRPWVLYWLAFQEKDYRLNMFDQSTDYYLKECMQKYSKTKAAKMCFELYNDITLDSYTGSRGTDVPANVQKEIELYRNMVK